MDWSSIFYDKNALHALVSEYVSTRVHNRVLVGWVGGAFSFLAFAYATSPGRRLAKVLPPPRMARVLVAPPPKRADAAQFVPRSSWSKFAFLMRIAIPSKRGKEMGIIALMLVSALLHTAVSVSMVHTASALGEAAVDGNMKALLISALTYILSSFPAALLESTLKYLNEMLDLFFRENVTMYLAHRYLADKVFFRLAGLHDIDHIDQRLTEDVQRWSRVSSALFLDILRPAVEIGTYTVMLARQTGWKGPALAWLYYFGFAGLTYLYAPNIDWMANERMAKEGRFRAAHQELLSYAAEVAITRGYDFQSRMLSRLFKDITDHFRYSTYVHARFNLMQVSYTKYGTVLLGYIMCGMSALRARTMGPNGEVTTPSAAETMQVYSSTSYTFAKLAKSIGRFLWNAKLILAVNGYTQRVFQLVEALELAEHDVDRQCDLTSRSTRGSSWNLDCSGTLLDPGSESFGQIVRSDHIEFVDVPLTLPNGEVLCRYLSFYVKPGMNLLIMGPNGCGKSSTFRLLGELWPLRGGRIMKPERNQLYYVPQRPYMYDGTLFEQVIYPLKRRDVNVSEAELYSYMEMAGLEGIFSRTNVSWDSHLSWANEALSVGEKQRLAMARLFFHRPRFAILDECSSLIDLDVEESLYSRCRELGISLITIAHRRSVWRYHNWILHFDGCGGYLFSPLRFENGGSTLVLSRVAAASDESKIGTEVVVKVSDRWEDELISAQVV